MKKFAALIAPALLSSFSALARPDTSIIELEYPKSHPGQVVAKFKVNALCGNSVSISKASKLQNDRLVVTLTVEGARCKAGEKSYIDRLGYIFDIKAEADGLGIKGNIPPLKIETKLNLK